MTWLYLVYIWLDLISSYLILHDDWWVRKNSTTYIISNNDDQYKKNITIRYWLCLDWLELFKVSGSYRVNIQNISEYTKVMHMTTKGYEICSKSLNIYKHLKGLAVKLQDKKMDLWDFQLFYNFNGFISTAKQWYTK